VILDDGFQHRRLARDADIVLIDSTLQDSMLKLLPRGMLREPFGQLRRATAVILTRCELADHATMKRWQDRLSALASVPIYHARTTVEKTLDESGQSVEIRGRAAISFCGLGNPSAFEATARRLGAVLRDCQRFDDHYEYSAEDLAALGRRAKECGAELLLTSEKDWIKIESIGEHSRSLQICRIVISIDLDDDGDDLLAQLNEKIGVAPRNAQT
jgi:tetraacyldisaccharide 4'-kinase